MKKIVSVCICVFLIVSVFCFTAAAKSDKDGNLPDISVDKATGNPGDEIFVNIRISGNSEITNYVLTLEFDKSLLKYESYIEGVLKDYTLYNHADEGRLTLVSLNENSKAENGNIITFKFKADKKAKPGDYKITLNKTSFADKDGNSQNASVKNGSVKISEPCKEKHGFSDWKQLTSATCANTGTDIRVCEECGHTQLRSVAAKGHELEDSFTLDVQAKDSKPGMLSRHCKICGAKTNIIIYTKKNTAGLRINSMVGKISDDSLANLIYFINGNVTYPDITDEDFDINTLLVNTDNPVDENGYINVASTVDRILRSFFGNDKKGGIIGAIKRAALADEIPVKFISRLVKFILCW